jgi:hypothetical protein
MGVTLKGSDSGLLITPWHKMDINDCAREYEASTQYFFEAAEAIEPKVLSTH